MAVGADQTQIRPARWGGGAERGSRPAMPVRPMNPPAPHRSRILPEKRPQVFTLSGRMIGQMHQRGLLDRGAATPCAFGTAYWAAQTSRNSRGNAAKTLPADRASAARSCANRNGPSSLPSDHAGTAQVPYRAAQRNFAPCRDRQNGFRHLRPLGFGCPSARTGVLRCKIKTRGRRWRNL